MIMKKYLRSFENSEAYQEAKGGGANSIDPA